MTEAARQARKEYKRKWRQEHPEAVKKHQADFWERQATKNQEQRPGERVIYVSK